MGPSTTARRREPPARSAPGSSQLSAISSDSSIGSAHSSVSRRGGSRVRLGPGSVGSTSSTSAVRPLGSTARGCIKLIDTWRAWLEDSLGPGRSSIAAFCLGLLGALVVVWATWRILGAVLDLWPVWLALAVLALVTIGLSGGARNFTFRAVIAAAGLAFVCLRRRGHELAAVAGALAAAVLPPPVLSWISQASSDGLVHQQALLEHQRSAPESRRPASARKPLSDLLETSAGEEESDDDTSAYLRENPHVQAPGDVLADRRVLDTPPYRSVPADFVAHSSQSDFPAGTGKRRTALYPSHQEHPLEDSELALEELQGQLVHPHQLLHHPHDLERLHQRGRDRPPLSELGSPLRPHRPPPVRGDHFTGHGGPPADARSRASHAGAGPKNSRRSDGQPSPASPPRRRWGWLARVFRRQGRSDQAGDADAQPDSSAPRPRNRPHGNGDSGRSAPSRPQPSEPPSVARTAPVDSWGGAFPGGPSPARRGRALGSPGSRRVSFSGHQRGVPREAQSALVPRRIPFDGAPRRRSHFEAALVEEEFGIAPEDEYGDGVTGSIGTYSVD